MIVKPALDAYAATLARKFRHDRTKTVGASEVGQCARRTYYEKRGRAREDEPEGSRAGGWGAGLRGTIIEEQFWVPAMRARYGRNFIYAGKNQRTFVDPDGGLSATPDGLVVNQLDDALKSLGVDSLGGTGCFLVDSKSIDPRVNLTREKEEHFLQVQVQMGLVQKLTRWTPYYAVLSYVDASFWDEVDEYAVRFDGKSFFSAQARARTILGASAPTDLKPEGWIAGGKECEYCPYTRACGIIRKSVPESEAAQDKQFVAELTDLCRYVQVLQVGVAREEVKINEGKEAIKERLRARGIRKVDKVVSWSPQKGRPSYDMKALREAAAQKGVDVDEYRTEGEPSDRLQITLREV